MKPQWEQMFAMLEMDLPQAGHGTMAMVESVDFLETGPKITFYFPA
jgi:hypothetical protein